jgi:uroporphyrin-III C-methyltransferase
MPLESLPRRHPSAPGHVAFVGAGPGDPDLLTLKALRALEATDVVLHDALVSDPVLALIPAPARRVDVGKRGFAPSASQESINALIVAEARAGQNVVRLKSGDPGIFGRLDDEIEACEAAGLPWSIVPGVTAASAAAASLGQSLTRRGRNSGFRLLTGQDVRGFAEHEWRALAAPGAVAAIYMGKRSARFLQGRLMMHGAAPATPVSVVENAGRHEERILPARLSDLPERLEASALDGPAILFLGLEPRSTRRSLGALRREIAS